MLKSPKVNIKEKSYKDLHSMGAQSYFAKDYAEAVFYFSKAKELGVKKLGNQLHDELADIYLLYGKSLLELARMEGDPFGENVPKKVVVREQEAEEDSAGEEEGSNNQEEEQPTDLQVASQILGFAKLIYIKREDRCKQNLADTLITSAKISMKCNNIQSAINDLKEAITLLGTLTEKNNRMLAEAYFRMGTAEEMENKFDEAINFYIKSQEVLINRKKDLVASGREGHDIIFRILKNCQFKKF